MSKNRNPPENEIHAAIKVRAIQDFWLGLIGSIVFNLIMYVLISPLIKLTSGIWLASLFLLPWVLNIVALIVAEAMKRPSIVWGILASYGLALAIALCFGLATCFGMAGEI